MEVDAVCRKFEPCLTAGCVCTTAAPCPYGLGCCSQKLVVIGATANARRRAVGTPSLAFGGKTRSPYAVASLAARALRELTGPHPRIQQETNLLNPSSCRNARNPGRRLSRPPRRHSLNVGQMIVWLAARPKQDSFISYINRFHKLLLSVSNFKNFLKT